VRDQNIRDWRRISARTIPSLANFLRSNHVFTRKSLISKVGFHFLVWQQVRFGARERSWNMVRLPHSMPFGSTLTLCCHFHAGTCTSTYVALSGLSHQHVMYSSSQRDVDWPKLNWRVSLRRLPSSRLTLTPPSPTLYREIRKASTYISPTFFHGLIMCGDTNKVAPTSRGDFISWSKRFALLMFFFFCFVLWPVRENPLQRQHRCTSLQENHMTESARSFPSDGESTLVGPLLDEWVPSSSSK